MKKQQALLSTCDMYITIELDQCLRRQLEIVVREAGDRTTVRYSFHWTNVSVIFISYKLNDITDFFYFVPLLTEVVAITE
jgi:hypothetical protein